MCFDPVWVDLVKHMQNRDQFPVILDEDRTTPLTREEAIHDLYTRYNYRDIPLYLSEDALDAKLITVERGVALRVETYALEAEPGVRDGPADHSWVIGTGHRIVERKVAEAQIEAKLAVARMSTTSTPAAIRRREDIQHELDTLRQTTKWFLL
jgi:hypothetical protein